MCPESAIGVLSKLNENWVGQTIKINIKGAEAP